ncbi:unnamed protein product [Calicophoron daubneyi]|uniref:C2H2-type domain-containing protein n=1 Tax=Calicophoron daubneyi TaxID=300641 RepID=A0AAV2TBL7_CALDB
MTVGLDGAAFCLQLIGSLFSTSISALLSISGIKNVWHNTTKQLSTMLAATLSNPFLNYLRGGTEPTLPNNSCYPRPDAQVLCRALFQHFGGTNADANLLSGLLNAKRPVPSMPSPVEVTTPPIVQPSATQTSPGGPTNFAMTAAIASALSSSSAVVGPQLLPACSPLLQLAIRQALTECLPNFNHIRIRGSLEISVQTDRPGGQCAQSSTLLRFSDSSELGHVNPMPAYSSPSTPKVTVSSSDSETHSFSTNQRSSSSSRRKSANPVKYEMGECDAETAVNMSTQFFSPFVSGSPQTLVHSGPTSPSTDSGVLDLSQGGSLAGSAPITPLKEPNFPADSTKYEPAEKEQELIEAYQKQLAIFSHLQSAWNRDSARQIDGHNLAVNTEALIAPSAFPNYSFQVRGHASAPNSPSKIVRQRVSCGSGRKLSGVRRPNSNRRFPCNQCREEFPSLHTLEEHTMFRHGTYRCHICKAQFTQRSNLQRHALKHVGFKPFECRVCSKAYYRKDHLMRHMEMGHPGFIPRENITVHLTSSESLDFLNRTAKVPSNDQNEIGGDDLDYSMTLAEGEQESSQNEPTECPNKSVTDEEFPSGTVTPMNEDSAPDAGCGDLSLSGSEVERAHTLMHAERPDDTLRISPPHSSAETHDVS